MSPLLTNSLTSKYLTQKTLLTRKVTSLTADFFLEIESIEQDKYSTPEKVSYLAHASAHLCNLKVIAEAMMAVEHVRLFPPPRLFLFPFLYCW